LPSEIVRFCALSGITIKELAGDPGGAQEAGATDVALALEKNIQEFNYSQRPFLEKLIKQLAKWGLAVPETFVIKGHWEWERDEALNAQAALQEEQMDVEHEKAEKKPTTKNAAGIDPYIIHELLRENAVPGVMAPITSSWVKSYGHDQDNFYMQFHGAGSTIFKYPYTDDPQALAEGIESSGSPGGFVHDSADLGVPRRTPYAKIGSLPSTMAWAGGSQASVEYESDDMRADKMAAFGTKRPARAPNASQYPAQTAAQTEQTTGPMQGPGQPDVAGITSAMQQQPRSFQKPDFAAMQGKVPAAVGPQAPVNPATTAYPGTPTPTTAQPLSTPVTLEHPLMAKHGHAGHSSRGRKKDEAKQGGSAYGVNYTGPAAGAYGTNPYSYNAAPIPIQRANASIVDLSFEQFTKFAHASAVHPFSKETFTRFRTMVEKFNGMVDRCNHVSIGNSMSFKDHPYIYAEPDGSLVVEYPCSRDWKKNVVGKTKALKLNCADTSQHGDTVIGTITYGWDDEKDCPKDVRQYDRANVMKLIELAGGTDGDVYERLKDGEEPDISTEYQCVPLRHNGRRWQTQFVAGDACLVDRGNCPSGQCDFVAAATPDS
jgi:hypothetical protein